MKDTILVTGGAGFIGSALGRYLLRHTSNVVVNVDSLTYAGNLSALEDLRSHPRHIFIESDICDEAANATLLERHRPRAVMHLAAETHVDRSISSAAAF